MSVRTASCQCGALTAACEGEPVRISVCHCLDCQKRSGSSFAAQARFAADKVQLAGPSRQWQRRGGDGGVATFHFCPTCGSQVWYVADREPDLVAVAIGAFADPAFAPPDYSVYEGRKHAWLSITGEGIDHYD
ncbi:GFA family protein [Citromicrobium bathyomarinum]